MRSVKIKVAELLAVLKTNRTAHEAEYNEAVTGFSARAIAELTKNLADAVNGLKIVRTIEAVEPKSYVDSYNTTIRMMEMSDDAVVELTQAEFSQYVEDKWTWQDSFKSITGAYNNGIR